VRVAFRRTGIKVVMTNKLIWRNNNTGSPSYKRVWCEDWAGDQFEVLTPAAFEIIRMAVNDVNQLMHSTIIELVEADDND
jgi:hypothetical protein